MIYFELIEFIIHIEGFVRSALEKYINTAIRRGHR